MTPSRSILSAAYGLIALLALVGTWGHNVHYLHLGFVGANLRFWQDTLANPASRSITADILFLYAALAIWMVLEARRLAMKGVWLYLLGGALIAISVTFPLFMVHRERALARGQDEGIRVAFSLADVLILAFSFVAACGYAAKALLPSA
jgi:hypothetical protein